MQRAPHPPARPPPLQVASHGFSPGAYRCMTAAWARFRRNWNKKHAAAMGVYGGRAGSADAPARVRDLLDFRQGELAGPELQVQSVAVTGSCSQGKWSVDVARFHPHAWPAWPGHVHHSKLPAAAVCSAEACRVKAAHTAGLPCLSCLLFDACPRPLLGSPAAAGSARTEVLDRCAAALEDALGLRRGERRPVGELQELLHRDIPVAGELARPWVVHVLYMVHAHSSSVRLLHPARPSILAAQLHCFGAGTCQRLQSIPCTPLASVRLLRPRPADRWQSFNVPESDDREGLRCGSLVWVAAGHGRGRWQDGDVGCMLVQRCLQPLRPVHQRRPEAKLRWLCVQGG